MPALHCAITSSGPETKNKGEPMTGIDKFSCMCFGIAIFTPFLVV
jgi:hypothetical protein